ncbi:antibiotic resistance protein [Polynucleobacter sp. QLW-P1DATA-2]|jgi:multiple antibiotic resistance protein|uniref:MarC family protein n=1 Tax=unclassified Polynucleobacter TaxID=2640945 RepID=UPI0008F84D8C|nr:MULTISPECIES: MarC family protein [unclassified Polynucleobacter]OIN01082.1 antibiotic resistance protein [Polynucleobacter sp. QLW-P1DATA-2]OIN02650.1 antibiotic resistance protein [Polynucleobacter sp. MWH-Tro8-2-5-gr]
MLSSGLTSFIAVFAALFPVINPLGDGPIFLNMVQGCSEGVRKKLARSVAINCFLMLLGSMLIGPQLLLFFGISLPALKLAGGAVVIAMGWNLLNQQGSSDHNTNSSSQITDATAGTSAFFPLTMPLTVGPGSIATAISLVAAEQDDRGFHILTELPAVIGATTALVALSLVIYLVYRESSGIQRLLGANGTNVLMRLFAFILLAIGVQIFLGGFNGYALELSKLITAH